MRFRCYAALLPSYGADDGERFTATLLDPALRMEPSIQSGGVVTTPAVVPEGYQVPIAWRPLVNIGPNRIGFVGEGMVFYAGDSQDRGGGLPGAEIAWECTDGWTDSGPRVAHVWQEAGIWLVTCTITANGATGVGHRYVRVYLHREDAGATMTVTGLGPMKSANGGWTISVELLGAQEEVRDWSRLVLYAEEFWGNPTDGGEVEDTVDLDPGSAPVENGEVVAIFGRYDPHVFFSGLVTGWTVTAQGAGGEKSRMSVTASTPEVLLRASEIFPTNFCAFAERLDSRGDPVRGYVLPEELGPLTSKDVAYQLIAGETNWCDFHDLALFTAEAPIINTITKIQVTGTRWGGLTQVLWSEFAVLYITKKGQAVVRIHANMLQAPDGQQGAYLAPGEPIVLLDRDCLTSISVAEAPPERTAYVKLVGTSADAKQRSWAFSYGAEGALLPPPATAGKWERLESIRTDADPDARDPETGELTEAALNAPLRLWAARYWAWRRSRYPQIQLGLGMLHFLEPYDLIAVSYVSD